MEGAEEGVTILALETATVVSSVAVVKEERVLSELTVETRLTHSETLVPHIEEALRLADTERGSLSAVAVSLGPGSFTGLRIGLATAKGLAYGLGLPLVGVPTLESMAAAFPAPGVRVAPLIDAQKRRAYMALYEWTAEGLVCKRDVAVVSFEEMKTIVAGEEGGVVLCGDMARKAKARGDLLPSNAVIAPPSHIMPRASLVAARAFSRLARGEGKSPMELEPLYIRRSEAEVLWEARHKEGRS